MKNKKKYMIVLLFIILIYCILIFFNHFQKIVMPFNEFFWTIAKSIFVLYILFSSKFFIKIPNFIKLWMFIVFIAVCPIISIEEHLMLFNTPIESLKYKGLVENNYICYIDYCVSVDNHDLLYYVKKINSCWTIPSFPISKQYIIYKDDKIKSYDFDDKKVIIVSPQNCNQEVHDNYGNEYLLLNSVLDEKKRCEYGIVIEQLDDYKIKIGDREYDFDLYKTYDDYVNEFRKSHS